MLNIKDLHKGDKLIKISTSRAYYIAGVSPTEEYETITDVYVRSVGRKYINLGSSPDSLLTEEWVISNKQPCNYLLRSNDWTNEKEKVFKSLSDYEDYKEYHRLVPKIRAVLSINLRDLSLDQLRQIYNIVAETQQ